MENLSKLLCPDCSGENERNHQSCQLCGSSLGFPNVNILADGYFQEGIKSKYRVARQKCIDDAIAEKAIGDFEEFLLENSRLVINMDSGLLLKIVNENTAYLPYQLAVNDRLRPAAKFRDDKKRIIVETSFYGIHGARIVYAALSLDGNGLNSYGDCSVVLQKKHVQKRTSVLSKNSFDLFDDFIKNGWQVDQLIPSGECGTWANMQELVMIKHGSEIGNLPEQEFAKLILKSNKDRSTDEFIELHIFNPVHYQSFEQVAFPAKSIQKLDKFGKMQYEIFVEKLKNSNITLIEK